MLVFAFEIYSANPWIVGCWNTSFSGISTLNRLWALDTSMAARNECPPLSKKLSSTPICSSPSTSCHSSAIPSSVAFLGAM
ncbi:hypothetical protein D3C75_1090210 [compost metagenome]